MTTPLTQKDVWFVSEMGKDNYSDTSSMIFVVRVQECVQALKNQLCFLEPNCVKKVEQCLSCNKFDEWFGGLQK